MLDRRSFLCASLALTRDAVPLANSRSECILGAIRWDAQYCDTAGQPCFEEEKSLGLANWQYRAPLHTQVVGPNQIRFAANQRTFDDEIKAAAMGGLGYWAYLMYGHDGVIDLTHSMMTGLSFHRASSLKDKIRYAMILTTDTLGFPGKYQASINKIINLMKDNNYQRLITGRPVLFYYHQEDHMEKYWNNSITELAEAIEHLRSTSQTSGLGNPYIIVLASPPATAEKLRAMLVAEAISTYAVFVKTKPVEQYSNYAGSVRAYWTIEKSATSAGVVPTVMIGWDTRPRKETPPSWEKYDKADHKPVDLNSHVEAPAPKEFAAECLAACQFVRNNPDACVSRLVLIYAWNEDSEGGPLQPTLGDPLGAKLKALRSAVPPVSDKLPPK